MPPRRRGRPAGNGDTPPVFDLAAMEAIIAERVAAALAAYETSRNGGSGVGLKISKLVKGFLKT